MVATKAVGNPTKKQILNPPAPHGSCINDIGLKINCHRKKNTVIQSMRKRNVLSGLATAHFLKALKKFAMIVVPVIFSISYSHAYLSNYKKFNKQLNRPRLASKMNPNQNR